MKIAITVSFLTALIVAAIASADFRDESCFPVGGGACIKSGPHSVDGDVLIRDPSPEVCLHDKDAIAGDDDNVCVRAACTTTADGTEDCDFTICVQEAGAACEDRITIDADGGITIGSANTNSVTLTTDGTGDGEVNLPAGSIGPADVLDTLCLMFASGEGNPTELGATDDFINLVDGTMSTTEANEDLLRPPVTTVSSFLQCSVDVAPGGSDIWLVTVRDDGVNTPVTCSISGAATTCTSSGTASIAGGSLVNLSVDSSTGATDPAAAAILRCGVCFGQ